MTDSYVKTGPGGTVFAGHDGVNLFRAIATRNGLRLFMRTGIQPNRAWTPTVMLRMAGEYTGKHYKRQQYAAAIADLKIWIDATSQRLGLPSSCD